MSFQRKLARQARKGGPQVNDLVNILSNLAPGLQQVEKQLDDVSKLGPSLETIRGEWEQALSEIQGQLTELKARQERQHLAMMLVLHDVLTGRFEGRPDLTLEEVAERVSHYTTPSENDE